MAQFAISTRTIKKGIGYLFLESTEHQKTGQEWHKSR